ncbi:MAG: cyclic nucleotide-binding domain-containing protein [Pseudomonadota bacterium]
MPLDAQTLARFEPFSSMAEKTVRQLAAVGVTVRAHPGADPFADNDFSHHLVYLIRGGLRLAYGDSEAEVVVAGSEQARYPLGRDRPGLLATRAMDDVELARMDEELVETAVAWDQLTPPGQEADGEDQARRADRVVDTGMFSAMMFKYGVLAMLPPKNVIDLIGKMRMMTVRRGDVVVREGDPADCYYMIENGQALVTRQVGDQNVVLAELRSGGAFGEDALVSGGQRNATVTMKSDGILLTLEKSAFLDLMRRPLLNELTMPEAEQRVAAGAVWLDLRYPPQYRRGRLPGAVNIPLSELRTALSVLDKSKEYVVYCHNGRSGAIAAFVMSENGFKAYTLKNGWQPEAAPISREGSL